MSVMPWSIAFQNNIEVATVELFFLGSFFYLWCLNLGYGTTQRPIRQGYTFNFFLVAWSLVLGFLLVGSLPWVHQGLGYSTFGAQPSAWFVKSLLISGFLLYWWSHASLKGWLEYPFLFLLILLGNFGLLTASHFLSFYLSIELQSLCFYVLVALPQASLFSLEAALKYFFLGTIASSFLLFGMWLLYQSFGVHSFQELYTLFTQFSLEADFLTFVQGFYGFLFLFVGLAFKLGLVPFHQWLPDVYEGAPLPITAFFATLSKFSFYYVVFQWFFSFRLVWGFPLSLLCGLFVLGNLWVGSFGALAQTRLKRLFAYSSLSHLGYFFLGLVGQTYEGYVASVLYLVVYLWTNLGVWSVLLAVATTREARHPSQLTDLTGWFAWNPGLALLWAFQMLSFAGLPPLVGFYPKVLLLFSGVHLQAYLLVGVALLASGVGLVYYLRFVRVLFFEERVSWPQWRALPKRSAYLLSLHGHSLLALGVGFEGLLLEAQRFCNFCMV